MEIELTAQESAAVRSALRSYLAELRMEIADTDNPEYKRSLRDERTALESAVAKLDASPSRTVANHEVRVVRLWWAQTSD